MITTVLKRPINMRNVFLISTQFYKIRVPFKLINISSFPTKTQVSLHPWLNGSTRYICRFNSCWMHFLLSVESLLTESEDAQICFPPYDQNHLDMCINVRHIYYTSEYFTSVTDTGLQARPSHS